MEDGKRHSYNLSKPSQKRTFFVTRESQEEQASAGNVSYVGMRNLSDLESIEESEIIGPRGTVRGVKNRVRAGLAHFQNPAALRKVSEHAHASSEPRLYTRLHPVTVQRNEEEGKIVVYTTSFRGLRATFEECKFALSLFHNLRVAVQERDIYVNQFFRRELEERLRCDKASVPQIFISGQHIGVRVLIPLHGP